MTLHGNGLSDTIRMVIARFQESIHRRDLNFEILTHFAKYEDEEYSALVRHLTKARGLAQSSNAASRPIYRPQIRPSLRKNRNKANFIEANEDQEPVLIAEEEDLMAQVDTEEHHQQSQEGGEDESLY